ncbi:sugar kinase [Pseudoprimorskyibacter insulae]|uniref:2-dehydro-3-deoxygluconokinase n=1 Tax=Pseudoprimorskyibacter insulae TaxID=1695997 RepID=A0A2R8AQ89_9RHOB|nr:sugar kinase [Pseudoprimorskyibacter insulae]SPF78004.1 2-dehydro-3-deoxygluconokinase [Pseudoprimorskyibacter insulae]
MTRSFLALGECMIEIAPATDGLCRMGYAGDTFNTAWYARRLLGEDWTVAYGTCVGTDAASDGMLGFIAGEGVDTSAIRRVSDRTVGLYTIALKDGERSFSYWRGQSAAKTMADNEAWLEATLTGRDVIHFSGITLAILAPDARQRFCAAVAKARANGAFVSFDTNLRPRLWESEQAMKDGLTLGASVADCVLPSFDEEEALFGDATPEATIERYRKGGATVIAVKNGGGDVTVWSAETGIETTQTLKVTQVDSTAAGDSFGAGFLCALRTGAPPKIAAQQACALAAQVIQHKGAIVRAIFEGEKA